MTRGRRMVHLVRHAMPVVQADHDPADWPLSPEGERAARDLTPRLPGGGIRLSSPEAKARRTLELACPGAVLVDARLGEVHRPTEPVGPGHREVRRAWVAGRPDERHVGWETPAEAAARFGEAIGEHDGDLVVATHGMVMTAWLVSIGHLAPGEPAADWWLALPLPALVSVELP